MLVAVLGVIFSCRFESLLSGNAVNSDLIVILLLVGILLAPMFPHVELFGLKLLRQEVGHLKDQISDVSASVQSMTQVNIVQETTTPIAKLSEQIQSTVAVERSPMQYKILKSFWTKQVNKYEQWLKGEVWMFRINSSSPKFLEWREAATQLILEGLVTEDDQGRIYLTPVGFEYCKKNYKDFGEDEFWVEETIDEDKLKKVLAEE